VEKLLRECTRFAAASLLAALAAASPPARAEAPCATDAARLCPGIPSGDGRLWACLQRNQMQLSSQCVRNLQELQRRASELDADCGADVYRFCPNVPVGQGRVLGCLGQHVGRRELSSNCEDAVTTALEKLQEFSDACARDAASLCEGVQPGGGRIFVCLRAQSERLSTRCRNAVNP
jgi:hypothetical protein